MYAGVAFVVAQVADIFFPGLGLPEWSLRLVLVLLVLGFPVALVLAWAFDITTEGVVRTESSVDQPPRRASRGPFLGSRTAAGYLGLGILMGLVTVGAYTGLGVVNLGRASGSFDSIAVLPFADLSAERNQEYFSDGITEEILNALSGLEGLRVAARSSAFSFRGGDTPVQEVAARLGVATVLDGSVRKSGNQLRITVRLVSARDGFQLWSETYDRELSDVFAVQEEISRAVVDALRLRLSGQENARLAARPTDNIRAHDLYLLGLYYWNRRSETDLRQAIRFFEHAVAEDATYAPAHAGIALAYAVLPIYTSEPPAELVSRGRTAAARALALDPALAEAHAAKGQIALYFDRDLRAAEVAYDRALALNPNYATAHQWKGELLVLESRFDESQRSLQRAAELDPLSPIIQHVLAMQAYFQRDYRTSIGTYEALLERSPDFALGHQMLGLVELSAGRASRVPARWREAARLMAQDPEPWGVLALGMSEPAHRSAALSILKQVASVLPPGQVGMYYSLLGDKEEALNWLEHGYEVGDYFLPFVSGIPAFDPLRNEPRFISLVKKLGL